MTNSTLASIAAWSYALTAAACFAFAIRMAGGWRRNARAGLLFAALLITGMWAAAGLSVALFDAKWVQRASSAADLLRYGAWFAFLGSLFAVSRTGSGPEKLAPPIPRWLWFVAAVGLGGSFALSLGPSKDILVDGPRVEFGIRVGLAVFGLMLVEQLLRRAQPDARWAIKPLCAALAGVFGFDLFLFADAMLFARIDPAIWIARAIANFIVIPFIAIATARNTGWTVDMHLSRKVVFQSTALLVSGAFLLAIAAAGYLLRFLGGDWGRALQIELIFAALFAVLLVASSGRFRSRLKVFVSKHFFSYRYDYREEWLRFTRTLSGESVAHAVQERTIAALANLVESPGGMLWLETESAGYRPAARWNMPAISATEPASGPLAAFLARTGWVLDLSDFASAPERYPGLSLPSWLGSIPHVWLVVPLTSGSELIGFVLLATPRAPIDVDWEVRDLLKTASQQASSYLGQVRATEALLEARKFDVFNRMSAFVVHDLKNLVAQLVLLLKNAERHRNNPEFQRDMMATVAHAIERMNKLMLQLRTGTTPVERPRAVDLGLVVQRACNAKANPEARIELELASGVIALGDEERLEHVVGHLVQNAIDATPSGGRISIKLDRDDRFAVVEVADTGVGMTPEFIRERLFKPFETTKKLGMGIGVYESSQYVAQLGGQLLVDSTPQVGTRVRVLLPTGDSKAAPSAPLKEVA